MRLNGAGVKGNPVKIGSGLRHCKQKLSGFESLYQLIWEGSEFYSLQARKPAIEFTEKELRSNRSRSEEIFFPEPLAVK